MSEVTDFEFLNDESVTYYYYLLCDHLKCVRLSICLRIEHKICSISLIEIQLLQTL